MKCTGEWVVRFLVCLQVVRPFPVISTVRRLKAEPTLRLKPLKSYAHALCQMLIGWRMQDDLNRFAQLPDGTLTVDALTGACTHNVDGELTTYIGPEIAAWFRHRLDTDGIPISAISIANVTADVHITAEQRRRDTRVKFEWKCRSRITAGDREFTSELAEPHTWVSGAPRNEKSGEP